jgi:cytochrome d ubiquinol oxidase subunit I
VIDPVAHLAGLALQAGGALGAMAGQEHLFQARQMQALSLGWHIVIVCFGVAFPAIVLFVEALGLRTGDPVYRTLAKRWSKAMLVLFAVGVVSGTILSFELGILWPEFMARFGDVFGLGFALEGFSFFTEAIFIAIYVYGWDRLPPKVHFLTGIPVAIAGIAGSLFVLAVNGWMNDPTGFRLVDGRAVDVQPWQALFGGNVWHELVHMLIAAYMVAGFSVAGVYAWAWLRGRRDRYHRIGLVVPLTIAALAAPVQLVVGDWAARAVADTQPTKLAAMEGLGRTSADAPIHVLGWYSDGEVRYGIEIPRMLSLLAEHDPGATVQGLDAVPADERPPVNVVRFAFQTMVGIGTGLALLAAVYLITWWRRRRLPRSPWFHRAVVVAGPAAVVALICGWITTEVGRQPWIVYRVMRTEEAVTGASGIPLGYATVAAVYLALTVIAVALLRRLARTPLDHEVPGAEALPQKVHA